MIENDYIQIPGKLSLIFKADEIDLLQVGVLGTHLHKILNQVAISMIQVYDELARPDGDPTTIKFIPQTFNREDALIKARLTGFREGSVEMDIAAVAAQVFSQPGAVSVLTNLLSSAIWAIGTYAARMPNIRVKWNSVHNRDDMYDILVRPEAGRKKLRPKIEKFIEMLAESSNGGRLHLKTDDVDFEIEFNPPPEPIQNREMTSGR
jgi:hypothetical protein